MALIIVHLPGHGFAFFEAPETAGSQLTARLFSIPLERFALLHFSHDRNLLAIRSKACFDRGLPHGAVLIN
jgi:hypothetical protein